MKYEGYKIGPVIRDIRKDKGLLIEEVAAKTGISVSTLASIVIQDSIPTVLDKCKS